ncbi:PA14 domain-containing protein [Chloroflexota bacterium]
MEYWNERSTTTKVIIIAAVAIIACACLAACAGLVIFLTSDDEATPTVAPGETTAIPLPPPTVVVSGWVGEYYDNRDLQGEPVLVRDDSAIDFDWGEGSPAPEIPVDNFSVRWKTSRDLPAGTYRFTFTVDDGVRLWIDDNLVLDAWQDGAKTVTADVNLTRGPHSTQVEYYEGTGTAAIKLEAAAVDDYPDWRAEYFDNPDVSGAPAVLRNEVAIVHNWGTGSPAPSVPNDNFSVRWTRTAFAEAGEYILQVDVEGGVRVWVDGTMLLDSWVSEGARSLTAESGPVAEGNHDVRVEYFKQTGNGAIRVLWSLKQEPGPPTAVITGPSQGQVGQALKFTARNSGVAPGSHLTTFVWDFGDGTGANGVNVTHIYEGPGTFEVQLTVTDDKNLSGTDTHQVQISPAPTPPPGQQPPVAVIVAPSEGYVGEFVTFDASSSTSGNPIVSSAWDFGDGTTANAVIVNKVYHATGIYNVILTVTDSTGLQDSDTTQITIYKRDEPATPVPTSPPEATATSEATAPPEPTATTEATAPPEDTATAAPEDTATTEPTATTEATTPPEVPSDTPEPTAPPEETATEEPTMTSTPTLTPTMTITTSP